MKTIVSMLLFCACVFAQAPPVMLVSPLPILPHQLATVPGANNLQITQDNVLTTVCVDGYTASERAGKMMEGAGPAPTNSVKDGIYKRDGLKPTTVKVKGKKVVTCCEVDHVRSLELGGNNSESNLSAQPYWQYYLTLPQLIAAGNVRPPNVYGAREKDQVEDYLHRAICKSPNTDGWLPLAEAQQEISTNWIAVFATLKGVK